MPQLNVRIVPLKIVNPDARLSDAAFDALARLLLSLPPAKEEPLGADPVDEACGCVRPDVHPAAGQEPGTAAGADSGVRRAEGLPHHTLVRGPGDEGLGFGAAELP